MRGRNRGRKARRSGRALGPLRKIIGYDTNDLGVQLEILECTHVVRRKNDFIGPTNAFRRRCRHCLKENPAAVVDSSS